MQNEKAKELKDGLVKLIEALATDTDEARQSTLFTSYLRACGMFHNYSWHNCALIWSQRPDASRVAGFQTWKRLGRYVVAGSKGIAIFAPMTFKDKSPAQDAEQESMRVWFRVVYVFDISQTRGESLPELPTECTGEGGESLTERLLAYAAEKGIAVETRTIEGSAKGYASEKGRRITLAHSLTASDRAAVLIHEISHCLLHFGESKPNLKQRELEAEATSFVVASHFGLNPESKFYLAIYGVKASDLLESLPVIQQTAAQIISACATNDQQQTVALEMAA
jgi:N-terminal domain of anti-restriction factor ArdC